jgi:hypothetical protein
MGKRRGTQKGAQTHAEGMHGNKTHRALIEQLQSGKPGEPQGEDNEHGTEGKHRLFEGREQHDEADKNSEKNRLDRDIQDHDHTRENFQVRGGAASGPAMPRSKTNPGNPDEPNSQGDQPVPDRVPGTGAN